jgi:PKD repeat protein
MNDLTFKDIKYVYMSTGAGGTFYVRNISIAGIPPVENVHAEPVGGWQVADTGGQASESNGTFTLSGDDRAAGPSLYREFRPETDFELSLQLKAETLGEVHLDPAGAGEGFGFSLGTNNTAPSHGVGIELRARAGGQFLLVWHDDLCDRYGWGCNWEPFVYNGIGYNDGSAFWHPNPPVDRSNATVRPGVWYTLKLKVQETPFTVTGEVYTENGTLLGSLTINQMNDFTFKDIRYVGMHSGFGGTFYVRNITGITPTSTFDFTPSEPTAFSPVVFDASKVSPQDQIVNFAWDFGDGNVTCTEQPVVSHIYQTAGSFNVTLTVTNSDGLNGSSSQVVRVWLPSFLSVSTDTSSSTVGSAVNINGRLTDRFGTGIANEAVAVYYTFDGADSWYPISSAYTNEVGEYSIQWMNVASGTFTLRAQWSGNATYTAANATTTLGSLPYQSQNVLFVESNSTVTTLAFNSNSSELAFTVSGPSGTTGYVKVTIAKNLLANAENLKVYLDGNQLNYSLTETADSWLLTFSYSHSTHRVSVYLPTSLPIETPSTTYTTPRASALPASNTDSGGVNFGPWIAIIGIAALTLTVGTLVFRRRKLS